MPLVVGVQFYSSAKMYYFACENIPDLIEGDYVVVETSRGTDAGKVVKAPIVITEDEVVGELKPIMRRATTREIYEMHRLRLKEPTALEKCREMVAEHKLQMKVLKAEYNFDGSRLLFYFTAEGRIDFRTLVRSLARTFKTRIDLHQVGVRDEAKLVGSQGVCGRLLCCKDWLPEFNKVSIRMAKNQNLSLNPLEISGSCGRLLCCLAYEDDHYAQMKETMPKKGQTVNTSRGSGVVTDANVITEMITVRLEDESFIEVHLSDIEGSNQPSEDERYRRRGHRK